MAELEVHAAVLVFGAAVTWTYSSIVDTLGGHSGTIIEANPGGDGQWW